MSLREELLSSTAIYRCAGWPLRRLEADVAEGHIGVIEAFGKRWNVNVSGENTYEVA